MKTITLHTIHTGARENDTKSNKQNVNRTLMAIARGHGKNKLSFLLILEHQRQHATCFMIIFTQKHIQL